MSDSKLLEDVLASAIARWFRTFAGISALDVASLLRLNHTQVMQMFEQLAATGSGSLNRDVQLYQVRFDPENIQDGFRYELVVTHIFSPSRQALHAAFYSSDLSHKEFHEYTKRLHLGGHQIELVFFDEEVLVRYFDHPELYVINDSLAGGEISSHPSASDDRYLYVRYGKCRLLSGNVAVTAIYKDLSGMGKSDQRYWHSYELDDPAIDTTDSHFQNFLARTYEGEFVNFEDPVSRLREAVVEVNRSVAPRTLFSKTNNIHLRSPVEQTYKSHCDAASELYKIVGPDNISQRVLKEILRVDFAVATDSFNHPESGRALSTIQLLEILEEKMRCRKLFTDPLRALLELRIDADHKVLEPESTPKNYSREFARVCNELAASLEQLARLIQGHTK